MKSANAKAPLSPGAIREIPFEWDSEAITTCIDQMTGTGAIPPLLMDPKFVDQRDALRRGRRACPQGGRQGGRLAGDAQADQPRRRRFPAQVREGHGRLSAGLPGGAEYLTTLASLNKMLHDPSMKKFLAMVEDGKERTVGHLIAFMNAYNLRFGPAKSDRQVEIYTRLVPILTKLRDDVNAEPARPISLDKSGEGMKSAAKEAFKGMKWDELQVALPRSMTEGFGIGDT